VSAVNYNSSAEFVCVARVPGSSLRLPKTEELSLAPREREGGGGEWVLRSTTVDGSQPDLSSTDSFLPIKIFLCITINNTPLSLSLSLSLSACLCICVPLSLTLSVRFCPSLFPHHAFVLFRLLDASYIVVLRFVGSALHCDAPRNRPKFDIPTYSLMS
jgi:hypothetical protein